MTFSQIAMFITKLLAGTGVFLTGVTLLTNNIEQLATSRIKTLFGRTANKRLINVGIGAITTAIIQSSGVTTVLIVGFVNVGAMSLYQATAMIMGANIGTTITAQIASLSAFPITTYVQILVFVGMIIIMVTKNETLKRASYITAGLGLIFVGLSLMSNSLSEYKPYIQNIFEVVKNPFLLFFIGIVITAMVQSSSATTSVIIAMSVAGLKIGTGGNEVLFIILGTNIGSCVTAIMSSFGAEANAKRAGLIHLMFNTFGSILFFILLLPYKNFMADTFGRWFSSPATQIAMFHTFFNVICTIIFLPFTSLFVKLSTKIIPEKNKKKEVFFFDKRMLLSPMIAVDKLTEETVNLADKAYDAFSDAFDAFIKKDNSVSGKVLNDTEETLSYSRTITDYLIELSAHCKSVDEEKRVSDLHNNIGDILRISEIADNFLKYAKKECEKKLDFSSATVTLFKTMKEKLNELFYLVKDVLKKRDADLLPEIEKRENEIDDIKKKAVEEHILRLNSGECKPENSDVFINSVSNLERLADHLTYIADTIKA